MTLSCRTSAQVFYVDRHGRPEDGIDDGGEWLHAYVLQLQPYVADKVYGDGPPTAGVWRSRQVVYARLNSTGVDNNVIGWRCVEGGKPGLWKPWTW